MAANKFATLIYKKTNTITLLLVYAFLEWTLISFLLLNSLFSYFILKFADFFGLKRPCLFCSRLDRFFDPSGDSSSYRDLLCHDHGLEMSRLDFCFTHRRVTESRDLCEECSSSDIFCKDIPCFPWLNHKVVDHGEADLVKCCPCCGASAKKRLLMEPFCVILDYTHKGKPIEEEYIDEGIQIPAGKFRSDSVFEVENLGAVDSNETQKDNLPREEETEELPLVDNQRKQEENRELQRVPEVPEEVEEVTGDDEEDRAEEFSCFISSFDCNKENFPENETAVVACRNDKPTEAASKHLEFYIDEQDSHLIPVEFYKPEEAVQGISECNGDVILDFNSQARLEAVAFFSTDEPKQEDDLIIAIKEPDEDMDSNEHHPVHGSFDDLVQTQNDEETDAEVSIGTEIPDHEQIDDNVPSPENNAEDGDNVGADQGEEILEFRTVTTGTRKPFRSIGTQFEEEKVPETPGLVDSPFSLYRALFLLDRKESGTEDSLDSVSVASEIECSDGDLTIEKLKSALREERKALNSLYSELEEERSASAVAANQTMAMINRLQEEKAAMQMEALQYQRMMEEQSEYDQEALQIFNELMVKREKELEVYRKRVEEYEEEKKMGMLRRRDSCGSCANTRDYDALPSVDMSGEIKEDKKDRDKNSNFDDNDGAIEYQHTPVDAVLHLEESLDDLEDERLSILEQLKILAEKLSTLNDEIFEDVKPIENGNGHIGENGHLQIKETNGKHKVLKSKRLLPLFNATDAETENGLSNESHNENRIDDLENSRLAIEEEVEELFERLQALEADREFLRHCVGSLGKGDKGVYLLQEILQNLRDLRNVELRVKKH